MDGDFLRNFKYNVFMSVAPNAPILHYSIQEYLRLEREAHQRHEYRDGEILAMAGGTADHSLIIANFIITAGIRLKGKPCRVYESNLRVCVARKTLYTYPDASIVCGSPEFDPEDEHHTTILNPRAVIEVVSPSTEGYDRGEKFRRYRDMDSLREYVLISPSEPRAETFFRQDDGAWLFNAFSGADGSARLQSVEVDLPLADLYAGIEFPAQSPE